MCRGTLLLSHLTPLDFTATMDSSQGDAQPVLLEDRVHLHPLDFPLSFSSLNSLNSLQLALVQYHFDTDDAITAKARILFRKRRVQAQEAAASTPAHEHQPPRPVPWQFAGLVKCLRYFAGKGMTHPLRSQIGSEIRKVEPGVYTNGGPATWKQLSHDAEQLGIVELSKVHRPSREWIALMPEVRTLSWAPSVCETAVAAEKILSRVEEEMLMSPAGFRHLQYLEGGHSASPPYVRPVFSMDFHSTSLTSPLNLADLESHSSAELLTIQFRDNIPEDIPDQVEALWWKRRSRDLDAGLEWPLDESSVPWREPPPPRSAHASSLALRMHGGEPLSPGSPSMSDSSIPTGPRADRDVKPLSPASPPSPLTPLPDTLTSTFFVLSITNLPLSINTAASLSALLPAELLPIASLLYAPSTEASVTRQAHIAYLDLAARTGALEAFNVLVLEGEQLRAVVEDAKKPKWEWGDVRVDSRDQLWRKHCAEQEKLKEQLWADLAGSAVSTTTRVKREVDEDEDAFGAEGDVEGGPEAKRRRLERFGFGVDGGGHAVESPAPKASGLGAPVPEDDEMKRKRAARFGLSTDPSSSSRARSRSPGLTYAKPRSPPARNGQRSPSPPLPPYPTSAAAYSDYVAASRGSLGRASLPQGPRKMGSPDVKPDIKPVIPGKNTDRDPVPRAFLEPLHFLRIDFTSNLPSDMRGIRNQTDLFCLRFHAVGFATYIDRAPFRFYIVFSSREDCIDVEHWVDDAKRYWKTNGLKTHPDATALPDREWQWRDFQPEFRAQHGDYTSGDVASVKGQWKPAPAKLDAWGRPIKPLAPGHFAWEQFFANDPSIPPPPKFRAPDRARSPVGSVGSGGREGGGGPPRDLGRARSPPYISDRPNQWAPTPFAYAPPPPAPMSLSSSVGPPRTFRDPRDMRDPRDDRDLRDPRDRDFRDMQPRFDYHDSRDPREAYYDDRRGGGGGGNFGGLPQGMMLGGGYGGAPYPPPQAYDNYRGAPTSSRVDSNWG